MQKYQIKLGNEMTFPQLKEHTQKQVHAVSRAHGDVANFYNLLNVINICLLLFLAYSYPAVAQFSFTLFINELLLCLAETLLCCCCCCYLLYVEYLPLCHVDCVEVKCVYFLPRLGQSPNVGPISTP